ncbi:uncharacterized protein [Periplaneta americana]|uniref:uncharacterized protein n=1 Tax=Periplaneta americana TaxID=6978 RepID=UPI0037E8B8EF
MFATRVVVFVTSMCIAAQALSPPGPDPGDPDLKVVIAAAQHSLQQTIAQLEEAAENAMASAKEILASATNEANRTILAAQAPLMNLLESVTSTVAVAASKAKEFGTNVSSCITGQEQEARAVVQDMGGKIVSCVTTEVRKAVNVATNMLSVASTAKNLLSYAPREFRACLPSLVPTIQEVVNIPSCIGAEIDAFSDQAVNIARALASYLAEGGHMVDALGDSLRRCCVTHVQAGTQQIRRIEQSVITCVQQKLGSSDLS